MACTVYPGEEWNFTHNGQEFRAIVSRDDLGAPWKEHDGHCDVREVSNNYGTEYGESKRPGEFVFHRGDRRNDWAYVADIPECLRAAIRDGWGCPDEDKARFVSKHGRQPTKRETAYLAVMADLEFLRGWLADDWCWVCLEVYPVDSEGERIGQSEYLGGIDSLSGDYIRDEVCGQLADECTIDESMVAWGTDE